MPNFDSDQRPSAAGLLRDLKDTFAGLANTNWLSGKDSAKQVAASPAPVEDSVKARKVEEVVVPAPAPVILTEDAAPDWLTPPAVEEQVDEVVLKESLADTIAHPPAAPTVVGLKLSESLSVEEPEIPAWLSAPRDSDVPTLVGAPPASVVEVPAVSVAQEPVKEKVEVDPFAGIKEFNGLMETIRQAQETLASGNALAPDQEKQAKIAAAKANSLLPKLPPDVLQSVILMKAVSSNNPKYGRNDFQREMLAVVDIIKGGTAKKA